MCEDYRARAFVDGRHDAIDREQGNRIAAPTLAIWEDPGDTPPPFDPKAVWHRWTTDLRTLPATSSPRNTPHEVAAAIGT